MKYFIPYANNNKSDPNTVKELGEAIRKMATDRGDRKIIVKLNNVNSKNKIETEDCFKLCVKELIKTRAESLFNMHSESPRTLYNSMTRSSMIFGEIIKEMDKDRSNKAKNCFNPDINDTKEPNNLT